MSKKNEESDELILVEKDSEQIRVHPLALEDHKRLGWKVVTPEGEKPAAAEAAGSESSEEGKPKGHRSRSRKRGAKVAAAESESSDEDANE